jgi:hypothetical protein
MNQDEILETFEFSETKNDREHFYRITANEAHYAIEKDGCIIAELICDGDWKQISGTPLAEGLIDQLGDRIEDHYY